MSTRDKSGVRICALKFAMAHENSLAAPIWRIRIQYSTSISLVCAPLIFSVLHRSTMMAHFLEKL